MHLSLKKRAVAGSRFYLTFALSVIVALFSLSLASCSGSSPATNPNAPITVWVDAVRLSQVQMYMKTHPQAHIKPVVADYGTLPDKVLLYNRTGKGWPDVSFEGPDSIPLLMDNAHHYLADLSSYVPKDVINNFVPGALSPCQINGKLYCLRNDLAPEVLWYNSKLMTQFGYTVPTTWEEYEALGLRVAKEHPGYVVGTFDNANLVLNMFMPASCPLNQVTGKNTVHINANDPHCIRAANLEDSLLAANAIAKVGPFDPSFTKLANEGKLLMMPTAAWFEPIFRDTYKFQPGTLAVGAPLRWSDSAPATGAWGGGLWVASQHSANPKLAADLITWLTTNHDLLKNAPGLPAYVPGEDAWSQTLANDPLFSQNPFPVLKSAAAIIDIQTWGYVRFDTLDAANSDLVSGALKGHKLASLLSTYNQHLIQLAKIAGYTVN